MKNISIVIFLFLLSQISAQAQCPGNSPFWGLNCFLSSDFMNNFEEARSRAEQSVRDFKALVDSNELEVSEEDLQRVIDAYNASATEFNSILYKIKDDLLDRKKRRYITSFSEDYSLQVEAQLDDAKDFYANNYQKTVAEVTDGQITGASFLLFIPELIGYAEKAFKLFHDIKAELKKYTDKLFELYLIEPYRFHSWDEIS